MMQFLPTPLAGAYLIIPDCRDDERGFFARVWCWREFTDNGLDTELVQCNISYNRARGTLRGMHYQAAPHAETKLVRCTSGTIYDVIVDLRPTSATFKQWYAVELSAANHRLLYIPKSFAHGFQTLEANCEVFYQMSAFYEPAAARGIRWDDPAFGIQWPEGARTISERDRGHPDFR